MTNGPPSSAAGPSQPAPSVIPQLNQSYYLPARNLESGRTAYQQWTSAWAQAGAYPARAVPPQYVPAVANANPPQRTRFSEPYPHTRAIPATQTTSPPPSPLTPPPPEYRQWDRVIRDFLLKMGLKQALSGFETDLLLMNEDFERGNAPEAINDVIQAFTRIQRGSELPEDNRPLEQRKLDYVHIPNPTCQTSITKSISAFLAQNRAKNDASNRAEFLLSLAEKRQRLGEETSSSCARTDAKAVDRDVQMKYDIARNIDGPLRRTVKVPSETSSRPRTKSVAREEKEKKAESVEVEGAGLDARLGNIETHFAVRYVPTPPDNFLSRLQFLEEHIIRLEKDYPPWAALHFNQPNRGWPPPPRATPIIVPAHLRSAVSTTTAPLPAKGGARTKNTGSTLQRAVLDQLAMREARNDLAGQTRL
ncbi:hypothetical protein C8F01DRAFT_1243117 [Mycena amicta]|nr:hypothetical protein C8F01DRAFT_1243117 [Mycena amicta]